MGFTPLLIPELALASIHFGVRKIRQALVCRPGAIDQIVNRCVLSFRQINLLEFASNFIREMFCDRLRQTKCQMKEKAVQREGYQLSDYPVAVESRCTVAI